MATKKKILITTGSQSEQYAKPLIKRLKNHPDFELMVFERPGWNFCGIYKDIEQLLTKEKMAFVIIPSDRIEHLPVAVAAFELNIPIVQLYAGDISGRATFDDFNRYVYSIYASVIFCATDEAAERIRLLYSIFHKDTTHIYVTSMTHFDDFEIDESVVPRFEYDLVLYNPITRGKNLDLQMAKELAEIKSMLDKGTFWLEPNEDSGRDFIIEYATKLGGDVYFTWRQPRPKFFGLLKHCSRLLTNSSLVAYEGQRFLKPPQIIHIGERNKGRDQVLVSEGGSDQIIKILEGIDFGTL